MKHVQIKEQKYKIRFAYFDDGWSFSEFWGVWQYKWEFVDFVK